MLVEGAWPFSLGHLRLISSVLATTFSVSPNIKLFRTFFTARQIRRCGCCSAGERQLASAHASQSLLCSMSWQGWKCVCQACMSLIHLNVAAMLADSQPLAQSSNRTRHSQCVGTGPKEREQEGDYLIAGMNVINFPCKFASGLCSWSQLKLLDLTACNITEDEGARIRALA